MTEELAFRELAFRADWCYRPYSFPRFRLNPDEKRVLLDLRKHGMVLLGLVMFDNPGLTSAYELETGTDVYRDSFDAEILMRLGAVQPQPTGWWISVYDTVKKRFGVCFTPSPWWPFYRRFKFSLQNPTNEVVTIYRASILCIEYLAEVPSR